MDDGIGRSAQRHIGHHGVGKGGGRQDPGGLEILPHHLHRPAAATGRQPGMGGVNRRNRGSARERHPEALADGRHRRGGAHRHAGAGRAGDSLFDLPEGAVIKAARLSLGPIFPDVGPTAEPHVAVAAGEHRTGGQEDAGEIGRNRPEQKPRHRLVAATHQHGTIDGVRPQHLLRFKSQQIAIEHRRRLHKHFRQAEHRNLNRKPTRLPDAALHFLGPLAEVGMALVEIAPGVEDRDHRLPLRVLGGIAHLPQPTAMAKAAKIVRGKPALRTEVGHALARDAGRRRISTGMAGRRHGCRRGLFWE